MKVNIKRYHVEDSFKRVFLNVFMPKRKTILATSCIDVIVPNSCCGCPIRRGQQIQLKDGCNSVEVNKYSTIKYNVTTGMWEILLSTHYVIDPIKESSDDGFSEYTVINL